MWQPGMGSPPAVPVRMFEKESPSSAMRTRATFIEKVDATLPLCVCEGG